MKNTHTIVQALHYVLKRVGTANKLKLVKLLFLADKYHLQLFGRTITSDDFIAMKRGPVGSVAKDILDFNLDWLEKEDVKYSEKFLERIGDYNYKARKVDCEYEMLSDTDKKALDFILNRFGSFSHGQLINLTHKFPEWARHEKELTEEVVKVAPIDTAEMFSQISPDPLKVATRHVEESKAIYAGKFC
jgi:uncharacterized phage-associated protein